MSCSGGNVSFLRIPSNIKQDFAPFQVIPGGGLQKFSFKPNMEFATGSAGLLNMVPSSLSKNTQLFKQDISYANQKTYANFNDILNDLPCIMIREYLPDTKLDQSLNFFDDLFTNIFKGRDEKKSEDPGKDTDKAESKSKNLRKRLTNVVDKVMQYFDSEGFLGTVAPDDAGAPDVSIGAQMDKKYASVVKFPYFLYYKLQSCKTTNLYELPCVPNNNAMYTSEGMPGWEGKSGMRLLPDFAKNIPIIGKMLDSLFGNMGVNFTPWWDAASGTKTKAPEIEFKFSLFNDSVNAAVSNYLFVNTIIAHARWIQYGIMQHSSSLYDISMAGIGKQYACTGSFNVQYKGTLRKPSEAVFGLLRSRKGSRYNSSVVNPHTIKIPDVYDVSLKFQSLLPQNFNTFIYNFAQGDLMFTGNIDQPSGFNNLTNAIKKAKDIAKAEWENSSGA